MIDHIPCAFEIFVDTGQLVVEVDKDTETVDTGKLSGRSFGFEKERILDWDI